MRSYQLTPRVGLAPGVVDSGLSPAALDAYLFAAKSMTSLISATNGEGLLGARREYRNRKSFDFDPYTCPNAGNLFAASVIATRVEARNLWSNDFPEDFRAHTPQGLRYIVGGSFVPHSDDSVKVRIGGADSAPIRDWVYNMPNRQIASVLFLNDDFDGGGLQFPNVKDATGSPLTIKPKAGQVVVFGGDPRYLHAVTEVTRGERYVMTLWYAPLEILPAETLAQRKVQFEAAQLGKA